MGNCILHVFNSRVTVSLVLGSYNIEYQISLQFQNSCVENNIRAQQISPDKGNFVP